MSYEECADKYELIKSQLKEYTEQKLNEADTRLKIIDEILFSCLGWNKNNVTVESHVHEGYMDYKLGSSGHRFLIEAKKTGKSFSLPNTFSYETNLTIKNLLKRQKALSEVYEQASKYAHESAIRFCVLTNGIDWVIFPGVRVDDVPIRESKVIIFSGLDSISENFLEFWGLLSQESVGNGSLEEKLIPNIGGIQQSFVFNSEGWVNVPFDRNVLAPVMTQILPPYFGDLLIEDSDNKLLEECYVADANISEVVQSLGEKAKIDNISTTIKSMARSKQFAEIKEISNKLYSHISNFLVNSKNEHMFQVILGRVGIGKSTFLGHFFKIQYSMLSKEHFVLRLNFHDVTDDTNIERYFEEKFWDLISAHELFIEYSSYENLRKLFQTEIEALERGPLAFYKRSNPDLLEEKISEYLMNKFNNKKEFIERLTSYLKRKSNTRVVFVFDNVDQLAQSLQEKVILFAYAQTRQYKAFSIVSMWEETFYAMKMTGRALATINIQPLEMVRQGILPIISRRLEFVIKQIENRNVLDSYLTNDAYSVEDLTNFLRLMLRSLTVENRYVRTFLEFIALGNIRRALEIFVHFMCAGSLETSKIIQAMQRESYRVPVHEFVKTVMLGSRKYYSERNSQILNLFSVGDMESPSHFTSLRLLQYLYDRRHESGSFGHGYVQVNSLLKVFNNIGTSDKDFYQSIAGLTSKGLVENELHAVRGHDEADSVRITATGRYYLTDLKNLFIYLDLTWHETPLFDRVTFTKLESLVDATDMRARFERVECFLDYLIDEENTELLNIRNFTNDSGLTRTQTSDMRQVFELERQRISARLGIEEEYV